MPISHRNTYTIYNKIEEIYAYTRNYSIFTVYLCHNHHENGHYIKRSICLNSALTLTWKFQGQIIYCLCLKNAWHDLHETKSSVNRLVDLFYIWPWPLILPVTLTIHFQGQMLKLPYLWNIGPDCKNNELKRDEFFGWFEIFDNIWPTFYFHRMLQCRSGVTFLSLGTSLWAYPCRNGDGVYLRHKACWGAVFGFTPYTHRPCMKFAFFFGNKDTNVV